MNSALSPEGRAIRDAQIADALKAVRGIPDVFYTMESLQRGDAFDPIEFPGDAMRLQFDLGITVRIEGGHVVAEYHGPTGIGRVVAIEPLSMGLNRVKSGQRAIFRCALQIAERIK